MLDLQQVTFVNGQHEDRVKQLAHDYRQGQADMEALAAFANRMMQRLQNAVDGLRRGLGSMPQNPELHY